MGTRRKLPPIYAPRMINGRAGLSLIEKTQAVILRISILSARGVHFHAPAAAKSITRTVTPSQICRRRLLAGVCLSCLSTTENQFWNCVAELWRSGFRFPPGQESCAHVGTLISV